MAEPHVELNDDVVIAEESFRTHIRYLILTAKTTTYGLARMTGVSASSINRYARRDTPDIYKFILFDNALFQLAINNGVYEPYKAAYMELVPNGDIPMTFLTLHERAWEIESAYIPNPRF